MERLFLPLIVKSLKVLYLLYLNQEYPMEEPKDRNKMTKNEKIFGLILVLIVGLAVVFAITSYDKPVEPSKPDRYEYQVLNYESIDPATLKFSIELTNPTEITWVKPSCTVTFESQSGQYRGWDVFTIEEPINGKSSRTFTGSITVSNEGSAHVTKHTVECE